MRLRTLAVVLAMLAALAPATAEPAKPVKPLAPSFQVELAQKDLTNVREVCGLAQKAPGLTLEQVTSVGTYCVDLLVRLGKALSAPATASTADAASKEPTK